MSRAEHPQDDKSRQEAIAERIKATYLQRTPASQRAFEQAVGILPQGVSGGAKLYDPYPVYLARSEGGHVWDVDGNDYVDFLMGAGPNILGHRYPAVHEAVARQLGEITQTLAPNLLEANFAERLRGHMPYLERIRFTNTGSEAVRTCLRVARAFTGRTGLAKFEGGFHGSDDPFLVSGRSVAGSPDRPAPAPDSAGIPRYVADDVLVLPYNDGPTAAALIDEHANKLAAVFMEPVAFSTGGAIAASPEFARMVREATERNGILLVLDEVVTCFRMGLGGSPAYLGVTPDLSAVGKAIGGGFPLAAMGGRAEVMETVLGRPSLTNGKRIFQSGTFTGNAVSLAAGLATLEVIENEPVLEKIDALADRFRSGLRTLFAMYEVNAHITGVRSVFQVHFGEREPTSRREIVQGNTELVRLFLLGLVAEGVLWPPIHPGVTAYTHSEKDIDIALEAAGRILPMFEGL